jgi:hypothetical protein
MAIVEIKKSIRPNTSVEVFNRSTDPVRISQKQATKDLLGDEVVLIDTGSHKKFSYANGAVISEGQYESDGLTFVYTTTHSTLEVYSQLETLKSIALDYAYKQYVTANGITHPATGQYTQTGINAPFSCTTTYNFPTGTLESDSMMLGFARFLQNSNKLESFTNTATQIVAVHHYIDSADFTEYHFRDFQHISFLHDAGATRTISYAML